METTNPDFPALIGDPEARQAQVINDLSKKKDGDVVEFNAAALNVSDTTHNANVNHNILDGLETYLDSQRALQEKVLSENNVARSRWYGLGRFFGENNRRAYELEMAKTTQQALLAAQTAAELRDLLEKRLGTETEEVKRMNKLITHLNEVIVGNRLGGPMQTSPELTSALKNQDVKQVYAELNLGEIPTAKCMSLDEIGIIRDQLSRENKFSTSSAPYAELDARNQTKIDEELKSILPMYEAAVSYANQHQMSVNRQLMIRAVQAGIDIMQYSDTRLVHDFLQSKTNEATRDDDSWVYGVGAYALSQFCQQNRIAPEQTIPYIMAFTAGVNSSNSRMPIGLGEAMRGWVADCLPVPGEVDILKDGNWITESTPATPRGFGSLMEYRKVDKYRFPLLQALRLEPNTTDPHLANAMNKALEMVDLMYQTMRTRKVPYNLMDGRRFDTQPVIITPVAETNHA